MPEGDPTEGTPTPAASSTPTEKLVPQSEVDRINAETRRKAEESATRRMLEALGVENLDAAKEALAAKAAADEATKSEVQRAQDALALANARAEQAETRARQTLVSTKVENALRDAGINPARIEGAVRLAPLGEVKIADDGTVSGIEDVVKAVKDASPEWFGAPGKPFGAPEVGPGEEVGAKDFRDASTADVQKELLGRYGFKLRSQRIDYGSRA